MLTIPVRTYPTTIIHSLNFYHQVLLCFIDGLKRNLTHSEIATLLNERGLLTPTGLKWRGQQVKENLKKIRLHRDYSSRIHNKLLELIIAGTIPIGDASILFTQRYTGVM